MRRKILSMFMLLAAAGFVSCDEDFDYLRIETRDEVDWTTITVTIDADEWNYNSNSDDTGYYYADVKVREIDKDVCRNGLVCCYMYDDAVQTQLPCTRYMSDGKHQWTRTIDFDFYKRGITIYVTDFVTQNEASTKPSDDFVPDEPGDIKFRIAVLN